MMAARTAGWAEQRQGHGVGQGLPRGPVTEPILSLGPAPGTSRRWQWQELLADFRRELPAVFRPRWGAVTGSRPPGDKLREGGQREPIGAAPCRACWASRALRASPSSCSCCACSCDAICRASKRLLSRVSLSALRRVITPQASHPHRQRTLLDEGQHRAHLLGWCPPRLGYPSEGKQKTAHSF